MILKDDVKYTKTHEFVRFLENGNAQIGITDYAQSELGDLVYVGLPEEGDDITAGEPFADVESVKAASEVFSPLTGKVAKVNSEVVDNPSCINEDAFAAWFVEVEELSGNVELLTKDEYAKICG